MGKIGGYLMTCDFCGREEFIPFSADLNGWHELGFVKVGELYDDHKAQTLCKECSRRFALYVEEKKKNERF